jgi:hypothetical protein
VYEYFLIWGVGWTAGYLLSAAGHAWVWAVIDPVAMVASAWVIRRSIGQLVVRPVEVERMMIVVGVIAAALVGLGVVFVARQRDDTLTAAYWPVAFGILYFALGIYSGRVLRLIGLWDVAVGLVALALPTTAAMVFLGIAGGGGMFVTGLWIHHYLRLAEPA